MACLSYDFNISALETAEATGNTVYTNGVIYVDYTDCSGLTGSTQLTAGVYSDLICADTGLGFLTLTYYQNDSPLVPSLSTYSVGSGSCAAPTPTATYTPSPTPTITLPSGTVLYVLTGTTITNQPSAGVCSGTTLDTIETYTAEVYDESNNLISSPVTITFDLSGTTTLPGTFSSQLVINSGSTSGFTTVTLVSYDDTCSSPGNCICSVNTTVDYFELNAAIPGFNIQPKGVLPTPTQTPTQTQTATPFVTPTITPTGDNCVCFQVTADVAPGPNQFDYLDCNYTPQSAINITFGTSVFTCAILGSESATNLSYQVVSDTACGGCFEVLTPTPTTSETPTQTPTASVGTTPTPTPTITDSPTPTPTITDSPTPTITDSPTPTPTNTYTPTETITPTPTITDSPTPTPTITDSPTPTITETPTETPTQTPTETPTQTPTNTETPTQTPSDTPTQTPSDTPTQTPTNTETPTQTPTNTETPTNTPSQTPTNTPTPTMNLISFQDCVSGTQFRFQDLPVTVVIGDVYYITGSSEYEGCATVMSTGGGPIYNGVSVTFTNVVGCGDDLCPRTPQVPALLIDCSTEAVFYATVDEDTADVGLVYEYNNRCYRFEEFSGPGGPYLGSPEWGDCIACLGNTPTPTPNATPTVTPTVSSTPAACDSGDFCFTTSLSSLSDYNGQYTSGSTYNGRITYSGGSISTGVIYYFTSVTESYWCLSATLGGTCLLKGSNPCYSACPDISFGSFESGVCPTPTPTPIDCSTFDFNAYFDCDWVPVPTPSPSIDCDDVNFQVTSIPLTPTPTPSGVFCTGKSVSFVINEIPSGSPTPTPTPTITLTKTVDASGKVTFNIFEETFSCVSVKVLNKCGTNIDYYTSDALVYNNTPIGVGMVMLAIVNNEIICVKYVRDDSNLSSNSNVDEVLSIYGSDCSNCSDLPTPTPTTTPTQTGTPSVSVTPTQTQSPTQTPTTTQTPTQTPPPGATPTATPRTTYSPTPTPTLTPQASPTNTPTQTNTPTPSVTPNWKYVYSSCSAISPNVFPTYLIQSVQSPIQTVVGNQFKDNQGNCWTYEGRFEPNYIAPPLTVSQTFSGDYFAGQPSITFTACTDCQTIGFAPCTEIYFEASVCGTSDVVVVRACDLGPCQTLNFGISTGQFCVTPEVGMTVGVYDSQGGDDFCVVLTSIVSAQPSTLYVGTPAYAGFAPCACPLYRVYKANSCDGLSVDVSIYDSPNNPIIPNGKVVGTDIKCYTITEYVGIKTVYPFLPGIAPLISTSAFNDCDSCVNPSGSIFCFVDGECIEVALTPGASTCADLGYNEC